MQWIKGLALLAFVVGCLGVCFAGVLIIALGTSGFGAAILGLPLVFLGAQCIQRRREGGR